MIRNLVIGLLTLITTSLLAFGYYQSEKTTKAELEVNELQQKLIELEKIAELNKKLAIRQAEKLQECEKQSANEN